VNTPKSPDLTDLDALLEQITAGTPSLDEFIAELESGAEFPHLPELESTGEIHQSDALESGS
jgi:hypothetical protein